MNSSAKPSNGALQAFAVAAFLLLLLLQLAFAARRNSFTFDECDHIYAGYMAWKHSDFGVNPEHPPLVKAVAALPLLGMKLQMPVPQDRNVKFDAFIGGRDFLFHNDADTMLFRARMAAASFTLLLALLVFLAAREMFGAGAGFLALALLVCDPNLLAHGALVTTDTGLSCFLVASIYCFYRYVKSPGPWRLMLAGLAAGCALAAKHTAILVFPMLILLALCELWLGSRSGRVNASPMPSGSMPPLGTRALRLAGALLLVFGISVGVLWGFYGFRYAARPAPLQLKPQLSTFIQRLPHPVDVSLLTTAADLRLLPESYLYGLTDVRKVADVRASFLFGKMYPHGVWFYFPVAFYIKSSLTFLALFLLALCTFAARKFPFGRETLFLLVPFVVYLAAAMAAGINMGIRHILPVYALLTILLGGVAWSLIRRNRAWTYVIFPLLLFQSVSTARAYPAYIAYANELWGGPSQTYKYLNESNVDWAQQLKSTKRYLDQHGVKECWFAYFAEGAIDYSYYGVPCRPLPTSNSLNSDEPVIAPPAIDGPVLISASVLSDTTIGPGALNPYEQFRYLKPAAQIDYGIFVFEGHFEIPLAASLRHLQRAELLLAANQVEAALSEAQFAAVLAPSSVKPQAMMGFAYSILNRPAEARAAYQRALTLAQTVEPEFQRYWIPFLQPKLAAN